MKISICVSEEVEKWWGGSQSSRASTKRMTYVSIRSTVLVPRVSTLKSAPCSFPSELAHASFGIGIGSHARSSRRIPSELAHTTSLHSVGVGGGSELEYCIMKRFSVCTVRVHVQFSLVVFLLYL